MAAGGEARWWQALNPPIYLISVLPAVGVYLWAGPREGGPLVIAAAAAAVVLLQHAINLFNDAADWRLGADAEKWDSWVRVHGGRPHTAALHGLASLLAGGGLGLGILVWSGKLWILYFAAPMILLGYLYNAGPRPLSYTHLGEWVTGLCYGPGVFGCLWLLTGEPVDAAAVLGMVAFAALAVSLLLSHQPPQVDTDRRAGKHSFAVRYGVPRTLATSRGLFILFLGAYGVGTWLRHPGGSVAIAYTALALVGAAYALQQTPNPKRTLLTACVVLAVPWAASLMIASSGYLMPAAS